LIPKDGIITGRREKSNEELCCIGIVAYTLGVEFRRRIKEDVQDGTWGGEQKAHAVGGEWKLKDKLGINSTIA